MSKDLAEQARQLRALHRPGDPLVLPNAWDAASARRFARQGFAALATTSAGVANAQGYADHEVIPPGEMFAAVARIAAAVEIPVSADLEAGYGLPAKELVEKLLGAGCVGLNLEDSDHARGEGTLVDAERQAERIRAVADAGHAAGVALVLNARVDTYLGRLAGDARAAETLRRGRLYLEAGACCVFPIGIADEREIGQIAAGVGGPVNVLALPQGLPLARLAALGVARVSFGSLLMKRALAEAERALQEFRGR